MNVFITDALEKSSDSLLSSINGTVYFALDSDDGDDTTPDHNETHHHDDGMLNISSIEVLGLFHSASIVTKYELC